MDARPPQGLRRLDVSDAGEQGLVEQRLFDAPPDARQPLVQAIDVDSVGERVWPERLPLRGRCAVGRVE